MYEQLLKQFPQFKDLGEVSINFISGIASNPNNQQIIAHLEPILPFIDIAPYAEILLSSTGTVIVNSIDIKKILNIVSQINNLSWINIAVSGVNLGVNLVGYYLINSKLEKLDNQLYIVQNKIESLIKNEQRKLLYESKLLIKNSFTLMRILENYGLNETAALSIELLLDRQENNLRELVRLHKNRDQISLSLDQIHIIYSAYVNLLKAYLTAIYLKQQNLTRQEARIKEAQELSNLLSSEPILYFIYEECLFNPIKILTESEIEQIIKLYKLYCKSYIDNLKNHYNFLIKTHVKEYQIFQKRANNAYQPIIWIKH
ncbi:MULTISPECIES: hypothetical protein [unclassified Microcoleus]|uniref:hypothetical protein n=1 Tax=unclassified Microcoleus TaxID=2642155 RepID=UPI0025E1A259|nr:MULTISPECIES: hypothetical protein [unclassified Microcoleus]